MAKYWEDLRVSNICLTLCEMGFNYLPNDKISDWSKLKAFADDKINVTEKLKFVLGRLENIVGKGESAGYQHFLLFSQSFQKASYGGGGGFGGLSLKVVIVCYRVNASSRCSTQVSLHSQYRMTGLDCLVGQSLAPLALSQQGCCQGIVSVVCVCVSLSVCLFVN